MRVLSIIVLVIAGVTSAAHADDGPLGAEISYYDFARLPRGTVAFFQGNVHTEEAAKNSGYFSPFSKGGSITLTKGLDYWFIVNNHDDHAATGFLRVKSVYFYRLGTPINVPVYLTRQGEWKRPEEVPSQLPQPFIDPSQCSAADFSKAHTGNSWKDVDKALGGKEWHAITDGADEDSWSDRNAWITLFPEANETWSDFSKYFSQVITATNPFVVNGMLFRFEQAPRTELSNRPLLFSVNGDGPIAAYISIGSPLSQDYQGQYFITFK